MDGHDPMEVDGGFGGKIWRGFGEQDSRNQAELSQKRVAE